MGKILVIAEKPSVARDIAKVLGCNARGNGCLIGDNYIVSWAVGHLVSLSEPNDYDPALKKWVFSTLPIIPPEIRLKPVAATKDQLDVLTTLINDDQVTSLICATDSGREGELIFRYIYILLDCHKPFQRLWISSMTDTAIKEGFKKLKDGKDYDNLYYSAKCRSEADWLVGINATRAYTLKYNSLLSIGRVQTPTLAIIVSRQKEIDAFDSKDYYEVAVDYGNFEGIWFNPQDPNSNSNTKIETKQTADAIAAKVKGQTGLIKELQKEEKSQPAPLLYDLTELQRDCNKKFGYSAQETLSIAQSLYETKKLVTYPRTDSRYLSDDMIPKLTSTLKRLQQADTYQEFATKILSKSKLPISKRIIDNSKVSDHHAIIPTDGNLRLSGLNQGEARVFNLIAIRFLAVFYPYYVYATTKVVAQVCQENFVSKGTEVLDLGWQEIYQKLDTARGAADKTKKTKSTEDSLLPPLAEGQSLKVEAAKVNKKKTQPPKAYTEASLLSAMENAGRFIEDEELREQLKDSGLGTPATRAAIIERLLTVGYLSRKGKSLIPTEKGCKLIEIVPNQLKSPQTTGKWEKGLASIAKGKMEQEKFMGSIKKYVNFLVEDAANVNQKVVFTDRKPFKPKGKSFGKCPRCQQGEIYENSKSFYCSDWQKGCKFSIWKNDLGIFPNGLSRPMLEEILAKGELKAAPILHPKTQEPTTATVVLIPNNRNVLQLKDLK